MKLLLENWRKHLNEEIDKESKLFELIIAGSGAQARELAVTLQLNIGDEFFEKLINYAMTFIEESFGFKEPPDRLPRQAHGIARFIIDIDKGSNQISYNKWESFVEGITGFLQTGRYRRGLYAQETGGPNSPWRFGGIRSPKERASVWAKDWRDSINETPI
jgi:hypothetical protein